MSVFDKSPMPSKGVFRTEPEAIRVLPTPSGIGTPIYELVLEEMLADPHVTSEMPIINRDMLLRVEYGIKEYGEPLKAHNGRPVDIDTKQEALDLCVYLRQGIEEGRPWDNMYKLSKQILFELYRECQ